MDNCLFATGGKNEIKTKLNIRKFGSASLDLAYVAAGRYDGFFQKNLSLWDVAAGLILIKESGGKVNEINLERNNNVKIYASNNSIHEKMLDNIDNF